MILDIDRYARSVRNPSYWGPVFWDYLYIVGICLPDELSPREKLACSRLLHDMDVFMPCKECKEHYRSLLSKTHIDIEDKRDYIRTVAYLHDSISGRLGKGRRDAKSALESIHRKSVVCKWRDVFLILGIFALGIVLYKIMKK